MNKYIPNMYYKNIYEINYKLLKEKGIKCILFDLDNTLVEPHTKHSNPKLQNLFTELKKDFKVIIFSNSFITRLLPFKKELEVDINHTSLKPLKYSFNKVLKKYKFNKDEVVIIGDQIFTDIIGGNNVGINTILVDSITIKDFFITKHNRKKEEKLFKELEEKNLFKRGKYYE